MCVINIDIQTKYDLSFAISNTILSLDKSKFTVADVIQELEKNNITLNKKEIQNITNNNLEQLVIDIINNLIECGKVFEEPRVYKLIDKSEPPA